MPYNTLSRAFHWLIATAILIMLPMGFLMEDLPVPFKFQIFGIHKSLGITILFLATLRWLWNFTTPTPMLPASMPGWQKVLAHITHGLLYVGMVLIPVTGLLMSSAGGFPSSFWGLFTMPDIIPTSSEAHHFYAEFHEILAFMVIGLLVLHVGAAVYHHRILKDDVLLRMLPARYGARLKGR